MQLKAVVRHGRIMMDEPTLLPEGTELVLTAVDEDDVRPRNGIR